MTASGAVGASVTITGSGFGAAKGGEVFLGTANGVVQSWSDGQIVALVAAGAASGVAQVLQNGVASNTVPFPILTALAVGHVTITAGSASTDVNVMAGPLALGTVLWSNPGDGSGVTQIIPAVPSPAGVADVFAFQQDGTVQAITSDGTVAWTADVSDGYRFVPDFQGGLVLQGVKRGHESVLRCQIGWDHWAALSRI